MSSLNISPFLRNFITDIPTDIHGPLSDLCEKALSNERPTGTIESATRKYIFLFREENEEGTLTYSIESYKESSTGEWLSYNTDTLTISQSSSRNKRGKR